MSPPVRSADSGRGEKSERASLPPPPVLLLGPRQDQQTDIQSATSLHTESNNVHRGPRIESIPRSKYEAMSLSKRSRSMEDVHEKITKSAKLSENAALRAEVKIRPVR